MEKQINIRVFGRVQGVYFRQSTKDKADSLGLRGIVINEEDGSVYISARGKPQDIEQLLIFCKIGPKAAKVKNVWMEEADELQDFNGFKILH